MVTGYLTRKATFSAAHRLHSQYLSAAENAKIYGKCNNKNGHGHNYTVIVTVRGEIEEKTGMIMNISKLKSVLEGVISMLDHRNLDADIEYFSKYPSTTENLCVFIWNELKTELEGYIYRVEIEETNKNSVYFMGEGISSNHNTSNDGHDHVSGEGLGGKLNQEGPVKNTDVCCFQCGRHGHLAKNCSESNSDHKYCFNCGKYGHIAAHCIHPQSKSCYSCGSDSHLSNECTEKSKSCYLCGNSGHLSKECPEKDRHRVCFVCGVKGHMSRDCNESDRTCHAYKAGTCRYGASCKFTH